LRLVLRQRNRREQLRDQQKSHLNRNFVARAGAAKKKALPCAWPGSA
jgi:hypothetical protein